MNRAGIWSYSGPNAGNAYQNNSVCRHFLRSEIHKNYSVQKLTFLLDIFLNLGEWSFIFYYILFFLSSVTLSLHVLYHPLLEVLRREWKSALIQKTPMQIPKAFHQHDTTIKRKMI